MCGGGNQQCHPDILSQGQICKGGGNQQCHPDILSQGQICKGGGGRGISNVTRTYCHRVRFVRGGGGGWNQQCHPDILSQGQICKGGGGGWNQQCHPDIDCHRVGFVRSPGSVEEGKFIRRVGSNVTWT